MFVALAAAVCLFDLCAMLTQQWDVTLSVLAARDWRVYAGLSALLVAIWVHLTIGRVL